MKEREMRGKGKKKSVRKRVPKFSYPAFRRGRKRRGTCRKGNREEREGGVGGGKRERRKQREGGRRTEKKRGEHPFTFLIPKKGGKEKRKIETIKESRF